MDEGTKHIIRIIDYQWDFFAITPLNPPNTLVVSVCEGLPVRADNCAVGMSQEIYLLIDSPMNASFTKSRGTGWYINGRAPINMIRMRKLQLHTLKHLAPEHILGGTWLPDSQFRQADVDKLIFMSIAHSTKEGEHHENGTTQ